MKPNEHAKCEKCGAAYRQHTGVAHWCVTGSLGSRFTEYAATLVEVPTPARRGW